MTIIYDEIQKQHIYKWRQGNKEKYLDYCKNKAKQYYQSNTQKIKNYHKARYNFKKECKIYLAILRD